MALVSGSEHINVLATSGVTPAIGSGGKAVAALSLSSASTASVLYPATTNLCLKAGCTLVVDQDYAGQLGFVGTPYSGAYVANSGAIASDPDYIRRVSFNVTRISFVQADGGLALEVPLPAGVPSKGMKMQQVVAFVDREGGSFFHEWSALFVCEGSQGDKLVFHYPRLQVCQSAAEMHITLAENWLVVQPFARFRALPIVDGNDGEQVLCYRSYYPGKATSI